MVRKISMGKRHPKMTVQTKKRPTRKRPITKENKCWKSRSTRKKARFRTNTKCSSCGASRARLRVRGRTRRWQQLKMMTSALIRQTNINLTMTLLMNKTSTMRKETKNMVTMQMDI